MNPLSDIYKTLSTLFQKPPSTNSAIEAYGDTDYLLMGELDLPAPKTTYWDNQIAYHQPDTHINSCTIISSLTAYSALTGRVFTQDERKNFWNKAVEAGANPAIGWYLNKAVELVADMLGDVYFFRMTIGSEEFWEAVDKGYFVIMGLNGNAKYRTDKNDGVLDGIEFGTPTYGHASGMVGLTKNGNDYILVVDNYAKRTVNTYTINKENIDELVRNGVFFINGYIYALKNEVDVDKLKEAKRKGLEVSLKIEKGRATYTVNKIEKKLAELEGREAIHYLFNQ